MRIGIDTFALLDTMAGAERYTQNVIRALAQIDSRNKYYIFLTPKNEKYYRIEKENFENVIVNFSNQNRVKRILFEQFYLPNLLKKKNIDILFSPTNIAPAKVACHSVVMIFDLHWFKSFPFIKHKTALFEKLFDGFRKAYVKNMIKISAKRADIVLTLSSSSKDDIVNFLGISPDDIIVTYSGAFSENGNEILDEKFIRILPEKYILFVGQLHKRKNVVRLIKAYNVLRECYDIKQKLLIVGRSGDGRREVYREFNLSPYKKDILILGYVEDCLVKKVYKKADVLVYPSLYEGFGIPVLEAMLLGTPVVTSKVSSLPEVGQDAAFYVDPESVESIADGIYEVLRNSDKRAGMIERGLARAEEFSWIKTACRIKEAFERINK